MLVIGIAGGTGSGKTTVVRAIKEKMGREVTVIPQDNYYLDQGHLPMEERQKLNFDHPNSIDWPLLVSQLKDLKEGRPIQQPSYSYITCTRSKETVKVDPSEIIIVEGILIFTNEELRDLFDIKVFVDADDDSRLIRVIRRDIMERGKNVEQVLERYQKTVKPMHLQFISPSKRYADIIIPQGGHNRVAINVLWQAIRKMTRKDQ